MGMGAASLGHLEDLTSILEALRDAAKLSPDELKALLRAVNTSSSAELVYDAHGYRFRICKYPWSSRYEVKLVVEKEEVGRKLTVEYDLAAYAKLLAKEGGRRGDGSSQA